MASGTMKMDESYKKTTFSLNLPSGYSFEQSHSYQLGNLVFIGGVFTLPSETTLKRITISNCVPDGFRCVDRIDFAGYDNSSDEPIHGIIVAANTGTIDFYRSSTSSLKKIAFAVVYPVI